ncbi:hypothetical protein IA539_18130 [Gordonia sp. zg691]|nr:hypothetical protein [Gordonia jinghuaiqii]
MAVAATSCAGLGSAAGFAILATVYAPWLVVSDVLSSTARQRRRTASPTDLYVVVGREAPPASIASVGICVCALGISVFVGPQGRTIGDAVFVSRGTTILVALGFGAMVWLRVLIRAQSATGRQNVAHRLAALVVGVTFLTSLISTLVLGSLVGSAFGFAIGALLVVIGGYLLLVPWSPSELAGRMRPVAARHDEQRHAPTEGEPESDAPSKPVDGSAVRRAYAGLCVFALFGVLVPAYVIVSGPARAGGLWLLLVPVVLVAAMRLAWLVRRGERRLLEMTFWVFTYTFMGLAPLAQIRDHSSPATVARVSWDLVPSAAGLVLFGIVTFLIGTFVASRVTARLSTAADDAESSSAAPHLSVSYRKLIALSVVTVLVNFYYLANVGVIQFTSSRVEAVLAYRSVWAAGSIGILILPATCMSLLVTWVAWMRFRREIRAMASAGHQFPPTMWRVSLFFTIVLGLLLANTMNPISNARYLSGTALLAAAVAFGFFSTSNRFRVMVVTFVLAFVVIFPLADAFRFSDSAEFKASGPMEALLSPDFDSFAQVNNGLLVAAREGVEPGRQFIGVLLWWFPRSLWPEKPLDTGIYIANNRGYAFGNLSAPLWVEFLLNGGWILVAAGMAILGYVCYRFDSAIDAQMQHTAMPTVLGTILPFYLLILLRGSLLQAMSFLSFILMFAFIVRAKPAPAGGIFNRRWLPDSLRYADADIGSVPDSPTGLVPDHAVPSAAGHHRVGHVVRI